MSETPETDAEAWIETDRANAVVFAKFARKLERERDEAKEELNDIRLNLGKDADGYTLIHAVCVLQNERDELLEKLSTTQTQTQKPQ